MSVRLNKVLKVFNIGLQTVVDLLEKKGYSVEADLNAKITQEQYDIVKKEFGNDKTQKMEAEDISTKRAWKEGSKQGWCEGNKNRAARTAAYQDCGQG